MNTRLRCVQNWPDLARQSGFKAAVLAEKLNISRWTLHRSIKKLFRKSPQVWLNERRLMLAVEMLKDCDSIKRLVYGLGYKSEAHFCHQFKRRYGMSATKFLKRGKITAIP